MLIVVDAYVVRPDGSISGRQAHNVLSLWYVRSLCEYSLYVRTAMRTLTYSNPPRMLRNRNTDANGVLQWQQDDSSSSSSCCCAHDKSCY